MKYVLNVPLKAPRTDASMVHKQFVEGEIVAVTNVEDTKAIIVLANTISLFECTIPLATLEFAATKVLNYE